MAIVAELRTVNGEVVRGFDDPAGGRFDAAGDFDDLLPLVKELPEPPAAASYTLLRYVDPYDFTVFNAAQMDDLLRDLDVAAGLARTAPQRRGLARARALALRCRASGDLYLWFVGD